VSCALIVTDPVADAALQTMESNMRVVLESASDFAFA
jgi:hypothetical protein